MIKDLIGVEIETKYQEEIQAQMNMLNLTWVETGLWKFFIK